MSRYIEDAELDNWFGYHPPSSEDIANGHDFVRRECRELAGMLNKILPEGPEKTTALRKIREAAMWGNAAIACKQEIGEHPWVARVASINVTHVTEPECIHVNVYADPEAQAQMAEWLGAAIEEAATASFGPLSEDQRKRFEDAVNSAIGKAAQIKREEPEGAVEKSFEKELTALLNRYSAEGVSGTPDFVLSGYLVGAIKIYNDAVSRRAAWRGELVDFQPWTHGQNGGSDGNTV